MSSTKSKSPLATEIHHGRDASNDEVCLLNATHTHLRAEEICSRPVMAPAAACSPKGHGSTPLGAVYTSTRIILHVYTITSMRDLIQPQFLCHSAV